MLAERGGRLVGTLIAGFDGWRGGLYRLVVLPSERRRGIATALVAAGERRVRDLGARRIAAVVMGEHEHAVGFWEAAGYDFDEHVRRYARNV